MSPLLTRGFVLHYAKTRWRFGDHATVDRSLRILQSAGLIARERMADLRGHPTAFRLSRHDVSLVTFVYGLYDEFLPHLHGGTALVPGVLPISDFARTLLLDPAEVAAHCESARLHRLLAGHGEQLRLVFSSLDVLVDHLLTSAL